MALGVWETFVALFRGSGETDEESDTEGGEGGFVPSPLDLSVRVAHGGPDTEMVGQLSKIEERARELKEQRRDK